MRQLGASFGGARNAAPILMGSISMHFGLDRALRVESNLQNCIRASIVDNPIRAAMLS